MSSVKKEKRKEKETVTCIRIVCCDSCLLASSLFTFSIGGSRCYFSLLWQVGTYLFVYDPVFEPLSSSSVADISTLLLENLTETVHELSEWLFSEIDNSFHILRDPAITRAHLSTRLEQYDLEFARSNIEFSPFVDPFFHDSFEILIEWICLHKCFYLFLFGNESIFIFCVLFEFV